ncbi:MAG: hypothetical protein P4L51_23950 [Puia sp.]|nr:hypothetical protein [Puia sp.]
MYNLLVSGQENVWDAQNYSLDISRCIRSSEYTNDVLAERFGSFTGSTIEKLKAFPCIFAYESFGGQPKFGYLKGIKRRVDQIIIECEYIKIDPWMDVTTLHSIQSKLDIYGWELMRTHWALKDVDLAEELLTLNIDIPARESISPPTVNPENHIFKVAFSFPGEVRPLVEQIMKELVKKMDPNDIFYDNHFKAYLARPNLDVLLGKIYTKQAKLIVVFLSKDYDRKPWPQLEYRRVREIIFNQQDHKVMYIRIDDAPIEGLLKTDGYIDANRHSAKEIADFIFLRAKAQPL